MILSLPFVSEDISAEWKRCTIILKEQREGGGGKRVQNEKQIQHPVTLLSKSPSIIVILIYY
jgi:hypothetical protein